MLTLSIERILLSSLHIISAIRLNRNKEFFFASNGYRPIARISKACQNAHFSIFWWFGDSVRMVNFHIQFYILAAFLALIGFKSDINLILTFLLATSLQHKNPYIYNSGDNLLRGLTFLLAFAGSGRDLSVDSLLYSSTHFSSTRWAMPLMRLYVSNMYAKTLYWKLRSPLWKNGGAIALVLQNENFPGYRNCYLPEVLLKGLSDTLTAGVLLVELGGAIMCFLPWGVAQYILVSLILLHLGIEVSMGIGLFTWITIASLLIFLPSN